MRHLAFSLCILTISCGPGAKLDGDGGGGGDGANANGQLVITPMDADLSITGGVAAVQDYKAIIKHADSSETDVTADTTFSIQDPTLGSFAGHTFTSVTDRGGHSNIHASAHGLTAQTGITIRLTQIVIGPGAPPDAPTKFGGADDPSRAPTLVYPNDGTMVPPNLNVLEFHFMPGAGNSLFELSFQGTTVDLKVYLVCTTLGAGCVYSPDQATWDALVSGEKGQNAVTYKMRGVDGANPGTVGTSAQRAIQFAAEDMTGGLYYWNAGAGSIKRYDFGLPGQTAENYMDAPMAGASTCVGCHVMSRKGDKMSAGMDIPAPSPYKVFDVATRATIFSQGSMFGGGGANFFTFSPDSMQMMDSNGVTITWRDANSGAAIMDPLVSSGAMPDWSPDGMHLVYSKPQTAPPCFPMFCGQPGVDAASLMTISYDGATWSTESPLVMFAGKNNYYPSYSPDGAWVMFNQSPGNMNSYDSPDAQVWVVPSSGGTPIQLGIASTGGDSWPKWAQIVQMNQGKSLMWFTFSSRRAYGLRTAAGATAQIWMAAFDPSKGMAGMDASYPAFWLPFQDITTGNHIAQWTLTVDRQPCVNTSECQSGEFCEGGVCVPHIM